MSIWAESNTIYFIGVTGKVRSNAPVVASQRRAVVVSTSSQNIMPIWTENDTIYYISMTNKNLTCIQTINRVLQSDLLPNCVGILQRLYA